MNKSELIDAVADATRGSKSDAQKHVEATIDVITAALQRGDRVSITGFGTFEVRQRAARKARNPQTGAEINVPATQAPAFKAGKGLKDAVTR